MTERRWDGSREIIMTTDDKFRDDPKPETTTVPLIGGR